MKREIRFRVWDRSTKQMLLPDSESGSWKYYLNGGVSIDGVWATADVELMQFTGLKDSKGKEIYEGDIIEIKDWNEKETNVPKPEAWSKGEVRWGSGAFRVHGYILAYVYAWCEVIGNLYENQELLK